jgi:DNA-binding MarR family transcriptional regulator
MRGFMTSNKNAEPPAAAHEVEITLGLLNAIERDSAVTQRSLASELGIALGLANAYLKRCAKKGLIKIAQVPANRYAYYLTPQGFAEKSALTARYLSVSFNLFRHSRTQYDELLAFCAARGWKRIALAGVGDLAEIAILCAPNHGVAVVGLLDGDGRATLHGLPVVGRLKDLGPVDAVLVTDMTRPQEMFDALVRVLPRERVLTPKLLSISRDMPKMAETSDGAA